MKAAMADLQRAGVDVSRETTADLLKLGEELVRWNRKLNLISKHTEAEIWQRHLLDAAQIWRFRPQGCRLWADLGSGAGLPGLVVALIAREKAPDQATVLVEADQRKCAFLRTMTARFDLGVAVRAERIEALPPLGTEVISARALAPLPDLLGYAARHLAPGGCCILHKGANYEVELTQARRHWHMDLDNHPSATDPNAKIMVLRSLQRVPT